MFKLIFGQIILRRIKMADDFPPMMSRKAMFKPAFKIKSDTEPSAPPIIESLDHLVLTVAEVDRTIEFYEKALGMTPVEFGEGRRALNFGSQKINLHTSGKEFKPHAKCPTPGSADLCFVTYAPLQTWIDHLAKVNVEVVEGPVSRTGAIGPMVSIYIRDPDSNLVEICNYTDKI